jgi:hypothetical protein
VKASFCETRDCTLQKEFSNTPNIGVDPKRVISPVLTSKNYAGFKVGAIVAFPVIVYLLAKYFSKDLQNFLKKFSKK